MIGQKTVSIWTSRRGKNIIRINQYLTNKRMEQSDTEQAQDHDMPEGEEVDMPENMMRYR